MRALLCCLLLIPYPATLMVSYDPLSIGNRVRMMSTSFFATLPIVWSVWVDSVQLHISLLFTQYYDGILLHLWAYDSPLLFLFVVENRVLVSSSLSIAAPHTAQSSSSSTSAASVILTDPTIFFNHLAHDIQQLPGGWANIQAMNEETAREFKIRIASD